MTSQAFGDAVDRLVPHDHPLYPSALLEVLQADDALIVDRLKEEAAKHPLNPARIEQLTRHIAGGRSCIRLHC